MRSLILVACCLLPLGCASNKAADEPAAAACEKCEGECACDSAAAKDECTKCADKAACECAS